MNTRWERGRSPRRLPARTSGVCANIDNRSLGLTLPLVTDLIVQWLDIFMSYIYLKIIVTRRFLNETG